MRTRYISPKKTQASRTTPLTHIHFDVVYVSDYKRDQKVNRIFEAVLRGGGTPEDPSEASVVRAALT